MALGSDLTLVRGSFELILGGLTHIIMIPGPKKFKKFPKKWLSRKI